MKKIIVPLTFTLAACVAAFAADDFASAKDAEALVSRTAKALASNRDATISEINAKSPKWVKGDLYPVVQRTDGIILANGQLTKNVGKDLTDMIDVDGREYVKERLAQAKARKPFWHDFKVKDPVSGKVLPKTMYCETTSDLIVCAGIYKR